MTRPARSDAGTDRRGIIALLVLGFALRFIIAYLLPGSGFKVDIDSFQFWSGNLAANGLNGFYDRPFFHDYTPGYLYVLWFMGIVGGLIGHPITILGSTFTSIDLLKLPPVLGDLAIAYLAWSMSRELGASERAARIAALLVVLNPVTWFDSVLWGQVDSVGVVVLLLALRELWRDRPERAAALAMLAALVKPQLGILIPIVAAVTIRRALWPDGRYGDDDPNAIAAGGATSWERRVTGPIRILTTGAAGLLTAILLSLPFGLSLPGLIAQLFKTAAGYPYVSVNAYNPWALVSQSGHGVATDHAWVCDSTIVPSGPTEFRIGPFVIPDFGSSGSTLSCPDGFMVGPLPAVVVGMGLFLLVGAIVVWLVARRPDRRTMLVGLAVLSLAFFVLPTRVHERYLFPLVGVAAILAGVSLRWRVAYLVASMAMLANMYAVLTTLYQGNPGIGDWLRIGDVLTSWAGVAAVAIALVLVFLWALSELRAAASEDLQVEIERGSGEATGRWPGDGRRSWLERTWDQFGSPADAAAPAVGAGVRTALPAVGLPAAGPSGSLSAMPALVDQGPDATPPVMPVWDDRDAAAAGPLGWVRARFLDRPVRADLSKALAHEGGGKLDRLDLWIVLVLVASLATVRIWRLAEPYDMHFDEVYHPRTATEFLQLWRYGMSHDIYEWTHPHLAKYAMAVGIMAFGDDKTTSTADLAMPSLRDAEVEPRWDDGGTSARSGDRLWLAGDDQVRAYDLATRSLIATWSVPGVTAISVDGMSHRVFVGTGAGDILTIDTLALDSLRASNTPAQPSAGSSAAPPPSVDALSWTTVGAAIQQLHATADGAALEVVAGDGAAGRLITIDAGSTSETGRMDVSGVRAIVDHGTGSVVVADDAGIQFVDSSSGKATATVRLNGKVGGLTATTGLNDNPLYASYLASDGPGLAVIVAGTGTGDARVSTQFKLPGTSVGPVTFDSASRMVHAVGTSPAAVDRGSGSRATVYVIEPHANAVYADAQLPFDEVAITMDDGQQYPATDRQQLLAFSSDGHMATVPIGRHAFSWRLPGVLAGILMAAFIYLLARLLFRRREVAVILAFLVAADGLMFVQSRIGMNDTYVGLGIIAAYTLFAWLWLRPGGTRRHWIAWAVGMPILGVILGLALAAKWVAAYAIGGMGILVLGRSALGRVLLVLGLVGASAVLGYIAISVPEGSAGGNYLFLVIMVALTVAAVVAAVLHPIAWTWEEQRLAIFGPIAIGGALALVALATGHLSQAYTLGPVTITPLVAAFAAIALGAAMYSVFVVAARFGFGPMALPPRPDDPDALLEPPSPAPTGWLNLGSGYGIPAFFTLACLIAIPLVVYVISYIPWAFVGQDQLWPGWPPGHTGQTLVDLTQAMYGYHNNLTSPHPATSPWWAWPLDLKPVWFYQDSFAGSTSASIYDSGNLVSWWLAIPAMAFVAYQSFKRRSVALALVTIAFATQWLAWARIDRAAFQYHYYTALPFLLIASAYLIAELWNGPSWRTWVLVRLAGATAVLLPFGLWLLHRPLCGVAGVSVINPGSQACPTTIPDVALSPRAIGIAIVVGLGVLLALRMLLSRADEGTEADDLDAAGWPDVETRAGHMRTKLVRAGLIALATLAAFTAITLLVPPTAVFRLRAVPVEPIALIVTIALLPVAAFVATARDARRFAAGVLIAIGLWFVVWYPNISALPLPSGLTNVFQGLLPTYLYPFQFWVNTTPRASGPLDWKWIAMLLALIGGLAAAVFYSTSSWRLALAERRAEASRPGPGPDDFDSPRPPEPPAATVAG